MKFTLKHTPHLKFISPTGKSVRHPHDLDEQAPEDAIVLLELVEYLTLIQACSIEFKSNFVEIELETGTTQHFASFAQIQQAFRHLQMTNTLDKALDKLEHKLNQDKTISLTSKSNGTSATFKGSCETPS